MEGDNLALSMRSCHREKGRELMVCQTRNFVPNEGAQSRMPTRPQVPASGVSLHAVHFRAGEG